MYLFELVFSFPLDKYPKVEFLDLRVVLFLGILTQKTLPDNIEEKFECYEQSVVTNKKDSLG